MKSFIVLIFIGLLILGVFAGAATFIAGCVRKKRGLIPVSEEPFEEYDRPEGCCGRHAVCEHAHAQADPCILYFDDEELDVYKGIASNRHDEEAERLFREVFSTMQTRDIPEWLQSLAARGLTLPESLHEEVYGLLSKSDSDKH